MEVLFRGKRVDNGEWVYGYLLMDIDTGKKYIAKNVVSVYTFTLIEVVAETVGQYIGFSDSDGTKIFEGDIVCVDEMANAFIAYDTDTASFRYTWEDGVRPLCLDFATKRSVQIIGNIYDNKE